MAPCTRWGPAMCPIKAVISASKVVINQSMWYMHRLVVGGAAAAWWLWPTLVGLNPVCCYCQVSVAHLPHLLPSPEPSPGDDCLSWPVSPPLVAAACLTPPPLLLLPGGATGRFLWHSPLGAWRWRTRRTGCLGQLRPSSNTRVDGWGGGDNNSQIIISVLQR